MCKTATNLQGRETRDTLRKRHVFAKYVEYLTDTLHYQRLIMLEYIYIYIYLGAEILIKTDHNANAQRVRFDHLPVVNTCKDACYDRKAPLC